MSRFTVALALEGQWRLHDQPALHEAVALARSEPNGRLVLLAARREGQRLRGPHQRRLERQARDGLARTAAASGIPLLCFPQHTTAGALEVLAPSWRPDAVVVARPSWLYADWPVSPDAFPRVFADFRRQINAEPERPLPVPEMAGLGAEREPAWEGWLWSADSSWVDLATRADTASSAGQPPMEASASSFPLAGDEASALERLQHYVFESHGLRHYKATRNALVGLEFSSKFSPFLAIGSLSVRRIWQALDVYDEGFGPDDGSTWMRQELLWREFFLWSEQAHGEAFHRPTGLQDRHQEAEPDRERFRRWTRADSGHLRIDALIHELNATGYLSNRGRQWVASHFVNSLHLPWSWGARYFEWMLIDADPALNTGNWAYLAGVGSDPRSFGGSPRQFDLEWQAQRYDPTDEHLKRWL